VQNHEVVSLKISLLCNSNDITELSELGCFRDCFRHFYFICFVFSAAVVRKEVATIGTITMLLRCFGGRLVSIFLAERCIVVNSSLPFILRSYHGHHHHHHRKPSSRFKWPHEGFMPSRTPYQMFPAISTPDEAEGLVSYLTKNERLLLLSELQKFREEEDVDGLYLRETTSLKSFV